MTGETVTIYTRLELSCYVRQEGKFWIGYCPSLDLASQGGTAQEVRDDLQVAAQLWFDSCIERGTWQQALAELGWQRISPTDRPSPGVDRIQVQAVPPSAVAELASPRGEVVPVEVNVPAFLASSFLREEQVAAHQPG